MLDDIAADDPVELLTDQRHDLAGIAAVDVVDPLAGDRRRARIDLDPYHAAFLPLFQRRAQRRFAAAELEDRFRIGRDARQQIHPRLPAQRAPAMDVIGRGEHDLAPRQRMPRRIVDRFEPRGSAEVGGRIRPIPLYDLPIRSSALQLRRHLLQLAQGQIRRRRAPLDWILRLVRHRQRRHDARRMNQQLPQPHHQLRRRQKQRIGNHEHVIAL